MLKTSRLLCALAILILLAAGPASGLFAQQEGSHKEHHKQGKEAVVVGCLDEGDEEGYYLLMDEDGEEWDVKGSAELAKHLGHTVRLTGSWEETGEVKVFIAKKIEHLSTNCDY